MVGKRKIWLDEEYRMGRRQWENAGIVNEVIQ